MRGITRRFGPLVALDGVDFTARSGRVQALVGENGAGKTTLMNIAFGLLRPNAGQIVFDGQVLQRLTPQRARSLGIGMVHQHFKLVDEFTVAESIALGSTDYNQALGSGGTRLKRVIEDSGLDIDLSARVGDLPVGLRQRVEILKALFRQARLLILDEPTAVLTPQEASELFEALIRLKDAGASIVLITHKLREALSISDTVTVIRSGRVVLEGSSNEVSEASLASAMVGRALEGLNKRESSPGKALLELEGVALSGWRGAETINLLAREGEIVGVAGVEGNGQVELADVLAGVAAPASGVVRLGGEDVTQAGVAERMRLGLAHIPEDRQTQALVLEFSVAENVLLGLWPEGRFRCGPLLKQNAIRQTASMILSDFGVRGAAPSTPAGSLSGGNQQRIVIGRQLATHPRVLIAFNPARGLDIAATEYVHRRILEHRAAGGAAVLISTDLDEVTQLSDRICVLYGGALVTGLPPQPSRDQVGMAMATGSAGASIPQ